MAKNDNGPEARMAQDLKPVVYTDVRAGPVSTGRGGGGNMSKPHMENEERSGVQGKDANSAGRTRSKGSNASPRGREKGRQGSFTQAAAEKGREVLRRMSSTRSSRKSNDS